MLFSTYGGCIEMVYIIDSLRQKFLLFRSSILQEDFKRRIIDFFFGTFLGHKISWLIISVWCLSDLNRAYVNTHCDLEENYFEVV